MRKVVRDGVLSAGPAWLFPVGLFLVATLLRLTTLTLWPFDGLYGQDPYFYHNYAGDLWSALARGGGLPRTQWPVGYPLLVALVQPRAGSTSIAAQWVSLLAGALLAPLVYLLAWDLLSLDGLPGLEARWTALAAGLLTAVSGQLLQSSLVVMSDAPALFWATLSAWAMVRYSRRLRARWLLAAAFALAWAVITRWEYALLILPSAVYLGLQLPDRKQWWHLVPASVVGLIVLIPQFVLLSGTPAGLGGAAGDGWSLLNVFRREFATGAGFDRYAWPTGLFYAKPLVSPGYLLPLFTPALVLGISLVFRRRWWGSAALLIGWGAAMYGVLAGLPFQGFRYALAYLPPVMILTAVGLRWILMQVPGGWRGLAFGVIVLGLVVMAGWGAYRTSDLIEGWQADKAVVRWAAGQLPAEATLFSHGLTLIAQHETSYQVFDLFEVRSDDLAQLTADGCPDYVLVDAHFVETQWAGRAPAENYRWLRDGPGLEKLGGRGTYTLYRVDSIE